MKKFLGIFLILMLVSGIGSGTARAEGEGNSTSDIQQKLNNIVATQTEVLKQLDEIKAELQIIKVRASLRS